MRKNHSVSDKAVSLRYWQARIAFGEEAVDKVLSQPPWSELFPNLTARSQSSDVETMRTSNDTILPGELLYEVTRCPECEWIYKVNPERTELYALPGSLSVLGGSFPDPYISGQDALLEFGAYAIFYSADNLYGMLGQEDPGRR